jgi:glycosyltransferase involved in cell wall biosynthesis
MSDRGGPLHVVHWVGSLGLGGEQTYLVRIANRLDRTRFRQTIAFLHDDSLGGEVASDVELVRVLDSRPARLDLRAWPKLVTALLPRLRTADVLATQSPGVWQLAVSAMARPLGVPVVHTIQRTTGLHSATEDLLIRHRTLGRIAYGLTDRFVGLSDYYKRDQETRWHIPAAKTVLNYMGVDLDALKPDLDAARQARRELGYRDDELVFGLVARQSPEKGVARTLRGFAHLRRELPQARLLLIGDGPERSRNEALASELSLGDVVHFAGARRDATRLMQGCDVIVQATRSPHNGISSIEGMAIGKPILTVVDGLEEERMAEDTCREGDNGAFMRTADYAGSAVLLAALFGDGVARRRMGEASRRTAERLFDLDAHVRRLEAIYLSVAVRKG